MKHPKSYPLEQTDIAYFKTNDSKRLSVKIYAVKGDLAPENLTTDFTTTFLNQDSPGTCDSSACCQRSFFKVELNTYLVLYEDSDLKFSYRQLFFPLLGSGPYDNICNLLRTHLKRSVSVLVSVNVSASSVLADGCVSPWCKD